MTVNGKPLPEIPQQRLWRYHKPPGLVTTHSDPQGRPTVFERLPETLGRVISVGRLDLNSEGLLLLTNDGGLARRLELPATGWTRRYRVRAHGSVDESALDRLKQGVTLDGIRYGPIEARLERQQGSNVWLAVALREGKNREVRDVLEALGLTVSRLIRIAYGPFQLRQSRRAARWRKCRRKSCANSWARGPADEDHCRQASGAGDPGAAHRGSAAHAPTACGSRCSISWNTGSTGQAWMVHVSSTRSPAPAPTAWRRCRAARADATFVDLDAAALAGIRRNAAASAKHATSLSCRLDATRLPPPPGAARAPCASPSSIRRTSRSRRPGAAGLGLAPLARPGERSPSSRSRRASRWRSPPGFRILDERVYGAARLVFLRCRQRRLPAETSASRR